MYNFNWNYNPDDYNANASDLLAEGKYRVRVVNAKPTTAKNGTEGLEITLEVYGHSNKLRYYIWFNRETPARTNQLLGEFFNSFNIQPGETGNCDAWTNKEGAVCVVHDAYRGHTIAKVSYCIARHNQVGFPSWNDGTCGRMYEMPQQVQMNNPVSSMPNEHVQTVPPVRQMEFNGFTF